MNAHAVPKSLLVVRLGAMGDVIHTIPAIASLRDAFPEMRIGWVIEQRWVELLCLPGTPVSGARNQARPLADYVHVVDTKRWRKSLLSAETRQQISSALAVVREQNYELVVDFQGALKSAVIAKSAGARKILGSAKPREAPAKMFYDERVTTHAIHVIEQYHSLAEAAAGKPLDRADARFPCGRTSEEIMQRLGLGDKPFILLNPGAGWGAKQWPPERYAEVARALAADGVVPVVNYGPGEEELAEAVRKQAQAAILASCTISELIALTRTAQLFIGGDTGPLHLAAALRVPVVAIFGPTDPARNGPYGTDSIVLRSAESRTSLSHTRAPDTGLLKITAEEVIAATRKLLEKHRG